MRGALKQRSKGTWTIIIDTGRDPATGKRRQRWHTVKGTKRQAEAKLTELLRQQDQGLPIIKGAGTVGQWLDRWLKEDVMPRLRVKSYERYAGVAHKHIAPSIGHLRLTGLTPSHIKMMCSKLSTDGMAPAGVSLVRNVLHGALRAAMLADLLARNPVEATPAPRINNPEVTPPDVDAIMNLLASAEAQGHPLFAALHLAAYTGARRGEILGLAWESVDLGPGTISITRSLGRAKAGLIMEPPKTRNGRRVIDLDARTVEVLRAHQGMQLLEKMGADGAYQDQGLVFANALGQPINPMQLTRAFQSLALQCGLGKQKLHALRHSHATILLAANESLFEVSRRLGHGSIATTADLYAHVLPGQGRKQADAFAALIEQAREKQAR